MKQFSNALIGASLVLACAASFAQPAATPGADQRAVQQEQRIRQGIASGQIDAREAYRLQQEQGRIDAAEARMKSDGRITAQERARLDRMQDRAGQDIWHQKHDDQSAAGAAPRNPTAMPGADRREQSQDARIRQGIASGQIDAREAYRLEQQQHIDAAEARAKADGHVTQQERARLDRMQDRAGAQIYHQKHDRQTAHGG